MTQEEFLASENRRNEENAVAYRAHMKNQEKLTERQVIAQEKLVKHLEESLKKASKEKK